MIDLLYKNEKEHNKTIMQTIKPLLLKIKHLGTVQPNHLEQYLTENVSVKSQDNDDKAECIKNIQESILKYQV